MKLALLPSAGKLSGVVRISEERNLWIKGTLWSDPSVVIEISFEQGENKNLPGTNISYMGIWRTGRKGCVFEFQLGFLAHKPAEEDWQGIVLPIVERLQGYRPINVML